MENYKDGSWVLSDQHKYLWLDEKDDFDVITFAKVRNQRDLCITEKRLDWNGKLTARCEATYGFTTTTEPWTTSESTTSTTTTNAATSTNTATTTTSQDTTTFSATTTTLSDEFINEEFNGCCKTWRIRNGEFKAFCDHKRINPLHEWWVYECFYDSGHDTGKS